MYVRTRNYMTWVYNICLSKSVSVERTMLDPTARIRRMAKAVFAYAFSTLFLAEPISNSLLLTITLCGMT